MRRYSPAFERRSLLFPLLLACLTLPPLAAGQTQGLPEGLTVELGATLHADARGFLSDDPLAPPTGFLIRRARIEAAISFADRFRVVVEPDFGEGDAELGDGFVEADLISGLSARAGRFKTPFGLEELRSSSAIWFAERGYPSALAPSRDLGVMLHGAWADARVQAAVGVFNGLPDGQSERGEQSDAKDVAARLLVRPFTGPLKGFGVGVAATTGAERGTADRPMLADFETVGGRPLLEYAGFADGRRSRVAPQGHFYAGPFGLLAEYTRTEQRVRHGATARTLQHQGWQAALAWTLTGEPQGYGRLAPARPVSDGGPGAVEVVARAHGLTLASRIDSGDTPDVFAWAVGANWYLTDYTRLMLTLERSTFDDTVAATDDVAETFVVLRAQFKL